MDRITTIEKLIDELVLHSKDNHNDSNDDDSVDPFLDENINILDVTLLREPLEMSHLDVDGSWLILLQRLQQLKNGIEGPPSRVQI